MSAVVIIVLAVVALALIVLAIVGRRRLGAQRALTAAAEERATQRAAELAATAEARDAAERARAEADERARAAEARSTESDARAAAAVERAVASEAERDEARHDADAAAASRVAAEERLAAFEARAAEAAAAQAAAPAIPGELDAQVLWALEKSRSERTWRHSVAVGSGGSPFAESSDPLREALQIELDAAREEVGAVVDLDADLPGQVSAAGAVLALRAAQELLAAVVRRSESTVLRVRADGADLVIDVDSVDEDGNRVEPGPLQTPPSPALETSPTGVRVRNAVAS